MWLHRLLLCATVMTSAEADVQMMVEQLDTSLGDAWQTYHVLAVLGPSAQNVYTIYGNSQSPLVFPPAYQVALPFGAHVGGTQPAFWTLGDSDS